MTSSPPDHDPRHLALRWIDEVWNRRRAAIVDELCARDIALDGRASSGSGIERVRRYLASLTGSVPDLRVEVLETSGSGDGVDVAWRLTGTCRGVPLDFAGSAWMAWRDGRLVEWTGWWHRERLSAELARHGARWEGGRDEPG